MQWSISLNVDWIILIVCIRCCYKLNFFFIEKLVNTISQWEQWHYFCANQNILLCLSPIDPSLHAPPSSGIALLLHFGAKFLSLLLQMLQIHCQSNISQFLRQFCSPLTCPGNACSYLKNKKTKLTWNAFISFKLEWFLLLCLLCCYLYNSSEDKPMHSLCRVEWSFWLGYELKRGPSWLSIMALSA